MKNMSQIKPFQLPYEYQRGGIPEALAGNYNCVKMKYDCFCNGKYSNTNEVYFFNKAHFETVLKYWNDQGERMGKTPCPADGKYYHWSYKETPQ